MAIGCLTALRNNMLDEITALMDAGAGQAKLRIYDGTQPATGGTATTLLAELLFTDPVASAASGGVLTFSAISDDTSANATSTATWFRVVDSNDVFVFDGTVTATSGGGDIELDSTSITTGQTVSVTSFTITDGNP